VPEAALGPDTIILAQMEVPPAEVARLIERAKQRGCRVMLNLAPAVPLSAQTLRQIDVLVANETEAASLDRAPADLAVACRLVLVVTHGERGASAYLPDGSEIAVPALAVAAIDTTGAGDTFVGVLAAALDAHLPLAEALRRASIAAGLSCRSPGAQPSMPTRAAIDAALAGAAVT
jgi:ribokinase